MSFLLTQKLLFKPFSCLLNIPPGSQHPESPLGKLPSTPKGVRNFSLHLKHLLPLTDFLLYSSRNSLFFPWGTGDSLASDFRSESPVYLH